MATFFSRSCVLAIAIALSACAARPSVIYTKITKPEHANKTTDSFYLQKSVLIIDKKSGKSDAGSPEKANTYLLASRPAESTQFKVGIAPSKQWGIRTVINIEKQPNTALISKIGVETSDDRVKWINSIGSVMIKALPLIGGMQKPVAAVCDPKFPIEIEFPIDMHENEQEYVFNSNGKITNEAGCIFAKVHRPPVDAERESNIVYGEATEKFYYSACRQVEVQVNDGGSIITKSARISDPSHIQFVNFPTKGSINMHSECGVSVVTEKGDGSSASLAIIEALIVQTNAFNQAKDALDKKK